MVVVMVVAARMFAILLCGVEIGLVSECVDVCMGSLPGEWQSCLEGGLGGVLLQVTAVGCGF